MNKAVVNGMLITSSLDAEELAFIGDMSLDTTADTLSGAINEHESDISTLNSNLTTLDTRTSMLTSKSGIPSGVTNLNNLNSNATYRVGNISTYTNAPTGAGTTGGLMVYVFYTYVLQVFYGNSAMKYRWSFDGGSTWNSWI